MRLSKQKRKIARQVLSMPLTAVIRENDRLDNGLQIGTKGMFQGGMSPFQKRMPKAPTGMEYPISMFVKNDTTAYLAAQKSRRAMIRTKV